MEVVDDSTASKGSRVVLPVVFNANGPQVLIFSVEDIKTLRNKYNILGVLIGTLAHYPQQNLFLSVPLRLSIWEVVWLIESNVGVLVDYKSYRKSLTNIGKDCAEPCNSSSNLVTTDNETVNHDLQLISQYKVDLIDFIAKHLQKSKSTLNEFLKNYHSYKFLKNQGFFISPGLKFGGELVIYPDDPLKYHSYAIVKFNLFNVNDLIVGGRLASGVKKTILLLEDKDENMVSQTQALKVNDDYVSLLFNKESKLAFSIEWAGFG